MVGHAKAITPLIPVPLEGPAYFVSYGGAKFPELVVVLQGYGVTIDLHGETFISKAGITSSTFRTVPDAPVGSFELTLPEGPVLRAGGQRQPLQEQAEDADSVHRPKRSDDPSVHTDRRHRVYKARDGEAGEKEAREDEACEDEEGVRALGRAGCRADSR